MKCTPPPLHEKILVLNEHHFCDVQVLIKLQTSDNTHGRSQDFLKGGVQPSLTGQTISPARRMYCAHITGDLK